MWGWELDCDRPWYLLLLGVIPLIWLFSFQSLAGLGRFRRLLALGLRTVVVLLIVLALAEVQLLRTSQKVTVIYLLDQSESIPQSKREAMLDYVVKSVAKHRQADREDRAGVIVFGRNATIEIPPFDDDVVALGGVDSYVNLNADATNLEAALLLAKASFPEDSAKRIVVVTDGNENVGDARGIAPTLAEDGIGIDVVPVKLDARAEVAVDKIVLPPDIRRGQPIDTTVVLTNFSPEPVRGRLRVVRRIGPTETLLSEESVELRSGKNVFRLPEKIEQSAVYSYQADFIPDDPRDDLLVQNNRATSFTHVRGKGSVLLIENWELPGEFDFLADRLRANNIEVTVMPSNQLFASLAELQSYDCVILANAPRSSGDDINGVSGFSDEQVAMLVRNTEQMGCGLVMLGGPNSFGVGGWANTELEKAMPVDFQIKNAKIRAVGALAMIMHASEIPEGNFWQKKIAEQAIGSLGPMDYCGVLQFDGGNTTWLWKDPVGLVQVGEQRNMMLSRVGRMTPQDMPDFDPGLQKALVGFNRLQQAAVKMMIVISDGDPSPPSSGLLAKFKSQQIQITAVAVGAHGPAEHQTLRNIANSTGGRYYRVNDPRALPKIYQAETRRVARPLIHENQAGIGIVKVGQSHEILQGIDDAIPPVTGLVMTTVKENPLVEVALLSKEPADEKNATLMAAWTYGLGRTAVLTTDSGARWATSWNQWANYDKLFSQLIRWAMRPVNDTGKFSVATETKDGKVRVIVTALDKDDEFLNFLDLSGAAIDPELKSFDIKAQQVAPGRYVAEFDAPKEGNYFVTISPGAGQAPLITGVNVPYSSEFRDRETNMALVNALAELKPRGGESGQVVPGEIEKGQVDTLLATDTFRRGVPLAVSRQDVWPSFLVIMGCVFFLDVLIRRVTVSFEWVTPAMAWVRSRILGKQDAEPAEQRLERLRSRKAAIAEQIDDRRAATRFEPVLEQLPDQAAAGQILEDASHGAAAPPAPTRPAPTSLTPTQPDAESYTSRLLKAKQQARKDADK